ncbi:oligopeptide/dipeptide ABC transporter ATP-binding protein [Microtetraspora malaysiensis]|uniref:Oligopeptide/dipeptide ABC transporter ATP-binding protein n=1 Tax=Microtetraspora malaysiensis TaxID=161358 RepID=A0ABW6T1Q4_9ACTN
MRTLELRDVWVRYGAGKQAFDAVAAADLVVPAGKVVGLVGESGSGKSTLARVAAGLVRPSRGQVLLDGVPAGRRRGDRRVQMVFQDPQSALDPRMTVGQSLGEALTVRAREARQAATERLLLQVGLDPACARQRPHSLSGGQRQRVALARALAAEPEVVVADEITSALDVSVQGAVLNEVRDLQCELGLTMLFISHDLAVVRYISDLVAVMYLGRVVEVGATEEILARPRHPYTQALVAGAAAPAVLDGDPPDPRYPPGGCSFHPRCPAGPRLHPGRDLCQESDPHPGAPARPHRSACHFAELMPMTYDGSTYAD